MVDYAVLLARGGVGSSKAGEIVRAIRDGIRSGALQTGQRMAGSTQIGRAFQCSGKPVEDARNKLIATQWLERRDGAYFFLCPEGVTTGSAAEPAPSAASVEVEVPDVPGADLARANPEETQTSDGQSRPSKKAEDFAQQLNDAFAQLMEEPPQEGQ